MNAGSKGLAALRSLGSPVHWLGPGAVQTGPSDAGGRAPSILGTDLKRHAPPPCFNAQGLQPSSRSPHAPAMSMLGPCRSV
ncbi:hypothetical protein DSM110093_02260 [Sulfitobacter sp. DSM 110093]|nr:hypothetical protein DSM110093_02260 [Sulfitobacter sp. DSM 110093]